MSFHDRLLADTTRERAALYAVPIIADAMRGDVSVFVPATGAIAIALKFHIDHYSPSLQQLRGFVREVHVCQKRPLVACG